MNNDEFRYGRRKYHKKLEEKQYYLDQKKRLEELLHTQDVQEYIEIMQYLISNEHKNIDDKWLSYDSFEKYARCTKSSKHIYMFYGHYIGTGPFRFKDKFYLRDIETGYIKEISINGLSNFESNNHIIYISNLENMDNVEIDEEYFKIREEYLCSLGELNQEQAKKMILKK